MPPSPKGEPDSLPTSMVPASVDPTQLATMHQNVRYREGNIVRRHELDELETAFAQVREALREDRLELPGVRVAAEWLLDNDYLIRRVIRQLRLELPQGFQDRLPRLTDSERPRILDVAEAIYDESSREFDLSDLDDFLDTYQQETPLTIAELWALPAILRFVILRRFRRVLESALNRARPLTATETDPGGASGRAIRALRLLAEADWKEVFSRHSLTEQTLERDPEGAYRAMDFETRDLYRRTVETMAFQARCSELEVGRTVLAHAEQGPPDGRQNHVGHWLIGSGRHAIEKSLGARPPGLPRFALDYPHLSFFGLLLASQILMLTPIVWYLTWVQAAPSTVLIAVLIAWIPASAPATAVVHWMLARLLEPRILPKLDFSDGIPEQWRTLVAVPTLISDTEEIDDLLAQLEIHFLANPDEQLSFALLTDLVDSDEPPGEEHAAVVDYAARGIRRLNARHQRGGHEPFHLLHRSPQWNAAEGKWMGWERKRGKLEELNELLRGDTKTNYEVHEGPAEGLENIAFVITLDSDTTLPPGAAARLTGALAHPLNRPQVDAFGIVHAGYSILQPRVEISPRSARISLFSRFYSGDTGIDIYTRAVSEVYQDLFGEGIFVGKGIYDVDAFRESLRGRVPENRILSHDLFEGAHSRAALATDIVVYEDYPPHYPAYLRRMHRWIRGDCQLAPWLLPRVPQRGGGTAPNDRIGVLDRFKIVDNLRRSAFAPALLALLLAGWFILPGHPLFWTIAALLAPGTAALGAALSNREVFHRDAGRWLLTLCFLPEETRTVVDATTRAMVRMLITHRRLLEWTPASQASKRRGTQTLLDYTRRLWMGPVVASLVAVGLALTEPETLFWAGPLLVVWFVSPEIARRISQPVARAPEQLDDQAVRTLRHIARRTWLFFETFAGPRDHWLPPDHFQEQPQPRIAHRTSPTNIAMLFTSQLAAYDLGYLGRAGLCTWASNTLDTVERLERHRGHIYNWYDTQSLEPLEPRYVSTVDSGNLGGALMALAVGCEAAAAERTTRPQLRLGLRDVGELLTGAVERWADASQANGLTKVLDASREFSNAFDGVDGIDGVDGFDDGALDVASTALASVEAGLLKGLEQDSVSHDPSLLRELRTWLERASLQLAEARNHRTMGEHADISERLRAVAIRARALCAGMDFGFLYDEERRLFSVGFNVSAERLDPHHYDLLASEARLASFLAIIWRQVPLRHWFALGRPVARVGTERALISWGGSMFEYLMPGLLMRSHQDTLLFQSCQAAVDRQIEYGRETSAVWGVSESGYAFVDGQGHYQYRAFGVPGLGLRRGLEEDLVVAPYASMLALALRPRAVLDNLTKFTTLGMLGRFGFYEAADFHPQRAPAGRPALVRSYMAHHHGMSLTAIDNHLNNDIMVERFHADPAVRSGALLLDERVPPDVPPEAPTTEAAGTLDVALTPPKILLGWSPDPRTAATWAMGNGTLTSFVTAEGAGGVQWRDLSVSRWEPDPVYDPHGMAIYLRDLDSGELIGATPWPVGGWPAEAGVRFEAGCVEFHRRHEDLTIQTRITVASSDDVELREIEIANAGDRPRRLEVVGCLEPLLAPGREASRHPAFSKLFLRCSPIDELGGVLVSRLGAKETPFLLFRMYVDTAEAPRVLQIDRGAFIGRTRSLRSPAGMTSERSARAESTLDPLCACGTELTLAPGSSRVVGFVTAVAAKKAEVVELSQRYGNHTAVRWAFEDAGRAASRRVQRLDIAAELLPAVQKILSALMVPDRVLRAPEQTLAMARPTQRGLWSHGISGDEPIVLVRMSSEETPEMLGEVIDVHRFLRAIGVGFDLVLVDIVPSGYVNVGSQTLRRFLTERGVSNLMHQRAGVHVVSADQISGGEMADLAAAASVHLESQKGSLLNQLQRPVQPTVELPAFGPAGPPPGTPPDPAVQIEVPALSFDCGIGGFHEDEYIIRPGAIPPAPWCNVIANEQFGCIVSESGMGSTWSMNAGENRLTPWRNDPVVDDPSEVLYLRDEETGAIWSTTPQPAGLPTVVHHGQGYTTYRSANAGLEQTMTVFVPPDEPFKVARLRIRNASSRSRRLTATYYAEWILGTQRSVTRPYITPEVAVDDGCLLAQTSWSADFGGRVAFLASDRPLHGWTTDRVEMLGRHGDMSRPAALMRWGLSGRVAPGLDPCAALQVHVDLSAGEEAEVAFILGQAADRGAALQVVRNARAPGAIDEAWNACRETWRRRLDAVRVRTPDDAFDRLCNRWLLYQALSSRVFGRTGFYQSSGAFGFRDQLQDGIALVHCDPALTRAHLLEAAAHQFTEGDVLHWWHPPGGAGVRTRCSDDLLWLVYATAEYVEATGDVDVLHEQVPFLLGEPLQPDETSRYARFRTSDDTESLLEHCRRAVSRASTAGPHGLPLIGDGDWNDGMSRVGERGRGESVWLAWFLHTCTEQLAMLLERVGKSLEARSWRGRLAPIREAVREHGWDGNWYRRAYHDDGTPIGSEHAAPPHIDSIAQTWAVMSRAGDEERIDLALDAVERTLVNEEDRLVLLLAPPFGPRGPDPGYIAEYPAGVRENGGQYTHAAAWLGFAHAMRGDGDAAHRIFSLINPLERTQSRAEVSRYCVEPYVLAADVYARAPWVGRGGWTWYTGSAAWTWRLGIEAILGIRRRDGDLEVLPTIPAHWDGFEAWVTEGDLTVHVVVHNGAGGEVVSAKLDGQPLDKPRVPLRGSGEQKLEIWLGETESKVPRSGQLIGTKSS